MKKLVTCGSVLTLSLALFVTGCGPSIKAQYDSDPQAEFSAFKTWAWISDNPMVLSKSSGRAINPLWENRIKDEINAGLKRKGYSQIGDRDRADFTVSFSLGSRDGVSAQSYPTTYGTVGRGWGGGRYYGAGVSTQTEVRSYTEGTLAIDVFDVGSKQPVWHGWASKKIYSENSPDEQRQNMQLAISEILSNFPQPPPKGS